MNLNNLFHYIVDFLGDFLKLYENKTKIYWFVGGRNKKNFGDLITKYIYTKITGKNPIWCNRRGTKKPVYFGCGSIMSACQGWQNVTIWGTGIMNSKDNFDEPTKVLAVRGPFTRRRFLELGYQCPEIYGDIGLLLPRFYDVRVPLEYDLGIIPHYVDYEFCKKIFSNLENVNIINVCHEVENVIDEIRKCKMTVSSSLHGIIVSHAYNIKSCWIKFSNSIAGDDIKYLDYFHSIKLFNVEKPIFFDKDLFLKSNNIDHFIDLIQKYPNPKFPLNTEKLFKTCPF